LWRENIVLLNLSAGGYFIVMEGVTTVIVAFIFVCVVYPHLVKNRPQFYGAFAAILLVILIESGAKVFEANPEKSPGVIFAISGLLQIMAILLMFMSCGGVSLADLSADLGKTIEVVRRGGEKETIIVPLTGERPKERD
jgi:hypothetical protein